MVYISVGMVDGKIYHGKESLTLTCVSSCTSLLPSTFRVDYSTLGIRGSRVAVTVHCGSKVSISSAVRLRIESTIKTLSAVGRLVVAK